MIPRLDGLAGLAWSQLWQVTALIVAAGLANRVWARDRPYLAHALWLVVLLKCVTPPVFSSSSGVFCWMRASVAVAPGSLDSSTNRISDERVRSPSQSSALSTARATIAAPETVRRQIIAHRLETVQRRVANASAIGAASFPAGRRGLLTAWLVGGWLAGTLVGLGLAAVRLACCWKRIQRSGCWTDPAYDRALARLSRRLRLRRRVRLVVTKARVGPAVFGLLRPTVLLPEVVAHGKSPEDLEPILAHELLHARRGDLWIEMLQTLARTIWWFHPLVWRAAQLTSREAERCCDEAVIAELNCDPARYARCLYEVLERKRVLTPLPALPGVRPVEVTSRRLERIMRLGQGSHKRSPWWCWAVMASAAAATLPGAALVVGADHERPVPTMLRDRAAPTGAHADETRQRPKLPAGDEAPERQENRPQALTFLTFDVADLVQRAQAALHVNEINAMQLLRQRVRDASGQEGSLDSAANITWSGKTLVVRDTPRHHDEIARFLETLRTYGFSQIIVETKLITGPPGGIAASGVEWTIPEGEQGELWTSKSLDTLSNLPNAKAAQDSTQGSVAQGVARTIRGKNVPARFALLDNEQATALIARLQTQRAPARELSGLQWLWSLVGREEHAAPQDVWQILAAPKIRVFDGQHATISDCSERPFVVSLKRVTGTKGSVHQPVIQTYEEGRQIKLRPQLREGGSVQLDFVLTLTRVVDVDAFTFSVADAPPPTLDQGASGEVAPGVASVQVPEVETTCLESRAVIPAGKTLVIGLETRMSEGEPTSALWMFSPTVLPESADVRKRTVRVYNVADFVVPTPDTVVVSARKDAETPGSIAVLRLDFAPLIKLITGTVSPDTWDTVGGVGTIETFPTNRALVVAQTEDVHERIAELLQLLRLQQGVQVKLQLEFAQAPQQLVDKLAIDAASEKAPAVIAPDKADLFRALVKQDDAALRRVMPSVTLFQRQRAEVWLPIAQEDAGKQPSVSLRANASDDRRVVRLSIASGKLDSDGATAARHDVSVPDGHALMCDVSDQARETGISVDPMVSHGAPGLRTFLLITPSVVTQAEEEKPIAGRAQPED